MSTMLGLTTVVVVGTVLATNGTASASASVQLSYVALGDSYAAGVGTFDYAASSDACLRSPEGYPALLSASTSSFVSEACSGATTADVLSTQMADLGTGTNLITITVGGNDVGFTNVAATCLLGSDDQCTAAVTTATTAVNSTLVTNLDKTFTAIQNKAPNARVVVSGYPYLVDPTATDCSLSLTKRQALNRGADAMDTVIAARSTAAGFTFADARPTFAGHGVCSANPWINAFSSDHVTETFHPTIDGYRLGYLPAERAATLPLATPGELPVGYTRCGGESTTCSFSGTRMVAFGAGAYRYRSAAGSISCDSKTFGGDPAAGVLKSCFVAPVGGPQGWSLCATENATCTVTSPTLVTYGANGGFLTKPVTGAVTCKSATFGGDPMAGVVKGCYLPPAGAPAGGWVQCAAEGSTCSPLGTRSVAFGANGAFVTARSAGATPCSGIAFGSDPVAGVAKACYQRAGGPTGYATTCARENGTCSFTGTQTVAFGEAGGYVYRTFAGGTACTVSAFGLDPAASSVKSCYVSP